MKNFPVLIKVDDLSLNSDLLHWSKFIKTIIDHNSYADIGFISYPGFEEKILSFKNWLSTLDQNKFNFFNHGVYHKKNEFTENTDSIKKSFTESALLEEKIFGRPLDRFGAPYNIFSKEAINIWIEQNPNGYFYYPDIIEEPPHSNYKNLLHKYHISFERKEFNMNPVYNYFISTYKKRIEEKEPTILQIHPARWNDDGFKEFEKILAYLNKSGADFCLPQQFLEKVSSNKNDQNLLSNINGENNSLPSVRAHVLRNSHTCNEGCSVTINSIASMLQGIWEIELDGIENTQQRFEEPAILFIEHFRNYHEYENIVKKSQKGNRIRLIKKARAIGYTCDFFNKRQYIPDIVEINTSKDVRSGGKMPSNYLKTVEDLGGYPQRAFNYTRPQCFLHYDVWIGVFKNEDGYRQGNITTNKKLVGYIHLRRLGEICAYSLFLGHGDYLNDGVMNLLHHHTVEWILNRKDSMVIGLKYLMYGGINHGGEGRKDWKRREGFKPAIVTVCESIKENKNERDSQDKHQENTHTRNLINSYLEEHLSFTQKGAISVMDLWLEGNSSFQKGDKKRAKQIENLIYLLHNSVISSQTKFGKHVHFAYGGMGCVIHPLSEIDEGVTIGQGITIEGAPSIFRIDEKGKRCYVPKVGKHVYLSAGCRIFGGIEIGDFSIIKPNVVITENIPPFSIVSGSSGEIISKITLENCLTYKGFFNFAKKMNDNEYRAFMHVQNDIHNQFMLEN